MKRIDCIANLQKNCTGCKACIDICPVGCIHSKTDGDGFVYTAIENGKCIFCGKCYNACPIVNKKKQFGEQHLFAAYSKNIICRNNGSSGGIFELLAEYYLNKGYLVCGAAFDTTKLKHRIISSQKDIKPLLKSKYVQSDMEGIYSQIRQLTKEGKEVLFCGTPCQVSALINSLPDESKNQLFTIDIVCHGVPSQKIFDDYIQTLEQRHKGRIINFSFRIKNNKYRHAHGYSYSMLKNGKIIIKNGIYSDSSYYNAFKQYLFFRESCYECQYATLDRVSDITLADFWGVEKYDFNGNTDKGVSMVIVNNSRGNDALNAIKENIIWKEFPIEYGIESNYCLTNRTQKPKKRDEIIREITDNGYEKAAKKYFQSSIIQKIYWLIPAKARNKIRKLRGA